MTPKYFIVEDNTSYACCNLVLWDFLLIIITVFIKLGDFNIEIHTVFKLVISIVCGLFFLTLMKIKYLKNILTIILSAIWALVITAVSSEFEAIEGDLIWIGTIGIISFLICYSLHVWGSSELGMDEEIDINIPRFDFNVNRINKAKVSSNKEVSFDIINEDNERESNRVGNLIRKENLLIDEVTELFTSGISDRGLKAAYTRNRNKCQKLIPQLVSALDKYLSTANKKKRDKYLSQINKIVNKINIEIGYVRKEIDNVKTNSVKEKSSEIDESLFGGCTDIESLTKRYHMLMKTFHPDNANGDTSMTRKVQNTYEYMKKRF